MNPIRSQGLFGSLGESHQRRCFRECCGNELFDELFQNSEACTMASTYIHITVICHGLSIFHGTHPALKKSLAHLFFSISWSSKMTDCAQRIHHVFLSTHWCLGEVSFSWKVRGHQQRLGIRRSTGAWYGGFLKWWYPTTMGFPTKDDHFRVFWGYHHLRKYPYRSGTSVGIH